MKRLSLLLFAGLLSGLVQTAVAQVPHASEFVSFWTKYKNALKNNDADFLFGTLHLPLDCEGSYYNPEATLADIKENHMLVFPEYRHEMEFVRFDAILIERENAYIWLGYDREEDRYFFAYNKRGEGNRVVSSEKWWFERVGVSDFRLYRITMDFGDE
jgi:hypothetical protein